MKNVIVLICLALVCFSCKKNKTVLAEGRVVNPLTNEGVANVEVRILRDRTGLFDGALSAKEVNETFTDENGCFKIAHSGGKEYRLSCSLPIEHYEIGWFENNIKVNDSDESMDLIKGETMNVNFHTVPNCNYQLTIRNVNCFDANDKIEISITNEINSIADAIVVEGCDEVQYGQGLFPMGKIFYEYDVTRDGLTNTYYDTVNILPGIDNEKVIEY